MLSALMHAIYFLNDTPNLVQIKFVPQTLSKMSVICKNLDLGLTYVEADGHAHEHRHIC